MINILFRIAGKSFVNRQTSRMRTGIASATPWIGTPRSMYPDATETIISITMETL